MKKITLFILLCIGIFSANAQQKQYKVAGIGFYNVENLFDTEDTPNVRDTEFTPEGRRKWTTELYKDKLDKLSDVIAQLGTDMTPDGLAILGVSEIENRKVLEDLVQEPELKPRNYKIIHFDSPDKRGIDVGLIYQPKYFTPTYSESLLAGGVWEGRTDTLFTRDILYVAGQLDGEMIHLFVNHWPSRRGGEVRSSPLREHAASVCRSKIDEILKEDSNAKIFVMGDMNDYPTNKSVKEILQAQRKVKDVKRKEMFNPWFDLYKKGIGTTAYRDAWGTFDMVILSKGAISKRTDGYQYYKARIFNESFLIEKSGRYKGYPKRTFSGDTYNGGYSDHFPVFVYLLKEIKK